MARNGAGVIRVEKGEGCVWGVGFGELRSNVQNGVKILVETFYLSFDSLHFKKVLLCFDLPALSL